MRHPVASRSFVCRHRIGIQSEHSFKFDLAFGSHWYQQFSVIKSATFERAYRIGFADVLPDFSTDILCVQAPNTKTFSYLMRGRGGNINGCLPFGLFDKNAIQHSHIGIEVKASRYKQGWQGHNAENVWLMVFVFDSNRPVDTNEGILPKPFRFIKVLGAQIEIEDWNFSGRSETSRRTITASITKSGYDKMTKNTIYDSQKD